MRSRSSFSVTSVTLRGDQASTVAALFTVGFFNVFFTLTCILDNDHVSLPPPDCRLPLENSNCLTVALRLRNVTYFWSGTSAHQKHTTFPSTSTTMLKALRDRHVSTFTGIVTQWLSVTLCLSRIRQEAVPSGRLKTQEVNMSMPGISAFCSCRRNVTDV
ncbi:hypothetical protein JOB18_003059 [Solea senegalensis]|uniref:Secreted protein n=1 Tax=Solea senegalensis TaxID=28829 RepID=A0AAV6RFM8_SOLSE|nr:hypothetical protein JOB18_003059 [Solea senegalensis]